MTPKNLFNIVLKIFGLFFLRGILFVIAPLISSIPSLLQPHSFDNSNYNNYEFAAFLFPLVLLAFYVFIIYLLIFKTNNIIHKLKLDKGFNQEEFSFNLSTSLVLTIALIVTGGVILVDEIPNFCRSVFSYLQQKSLRGGMKNPDYSYIIISAVKIILGLLIIGERKRIVEFAERRQAAEV